MLDILRESIDTIISFDMFSFRLAQTVVARPACANVKKERERKEGGRKPRKSLRPTRCNEEFVTL